MVKHRNILSLCIDYDKHIFAAMQTTAFYLQEIEDFIKANPFTGKPEELYHPASYIMSLSGKRLRPVMVLMGCDAVKGNYKDAMPAAHAVEILHNFTLVHDDIMDAAPLRRGKPSVHEAWDIPTAILSGDMMMFRSVMQMQLLPQDIRNEALDLFNRTAIEVCEGQQLDMMFEQRDDVKVNEYIDMIAKKTSALLGACFALGGLCGRADKNLCDIFYSFGKNLGIAFQIHDDILDAFAPGQGNFGKQVGGDIIANKKTILLLKALEHAKGKENEELRSLVSAKLFDASEKVRRVKEIFISSGAKEMAEKERQEYFQRSMDALESARLGSEENDTLKQFAEMVMQREK
jgi:geranylgeranyl diphosphate synthase type II